MSERSPFVRALGVAVISVVVCAAYEVLKDTLFQRISIWQSHIATILFFTCLMFFLSWTVIRRERKFRSAIAEREEFADVIIENLPVPLCIFDADGRFLRWNNQLESKLGYSSAGISGVGVLDTISEEDRERIKQTMEASFSQDATEGEAFLLHRNGAKIPCYLTGVRIFFQGKPCILGIAVDISAQKRAQDQLRLQATALRAAANGIVITTHDGIIEWVNPAFTTITGYTMEEAIGNNPRLLRSGRHDKDFYRGLWSTISSGQVWRGEMTNCRKDGTVYTEEMTITPVVSDHGPITHYIAIKQDISARKQAEEALLLAERQYRSIFDEAIIGIFRCTHDGRFLIMNPAMAKMLRYASPAQAMEENRNAGLFYENRDKWRELQTRLARSGGLQNSEHEFRRNDGTELWLSLNLRCVHDKDGTWSYYEGTADDITERKLLESQLRQAQKMEAVGRLAGGVAHDFNNVLGVITGYSELLRMRTDLDEKVVHHIEQIHLAGRKAASLTQQLLAFSRKQIIQPRILDLNEVVSKLSIMLQRLIGDDIELTIHCSCPDALVNVDASQIDQVIMNLAVNARDAMPTGGKLIIETDTSDLDESYAIRHRPVRPGRYVRLTITDTGCGMDDETMSHLFEPFFTTKELGKGTGLGLSIVYGIVKQSNGYIWVYSEPGQGTSFKIYLPLHCAELRRTEKSAPIENVNGCETVLVVEDDQGLRSMVVGFLRGLGYSVLEAENGERALEVAANAGSPIQVLITDIVMPKMGGRELADRLISKFSNASVLYTSGYTHDSAVQTRVLSERETFLQKPFALHELSKKLREVIERKQPIEKRKAAAQATSPAS